LSLKGMRRVPSALDNGLGTTRLDFIARELNRINDDILRSNVVSRRYNPSIADFSFDAEGNGSLEGAMDEIIRTLESSLQRSKDLCEHISEDEEVFDIRRNKERPRSSMRRGEFAISPVAGIVELDIDEKFDPGSVSRPRVQAKSCSDKTRPSPQCSPLAGARWDSAVRPLRTESKKPGTPRKSARVVTPRDVADEGKRYDDNSIHHPRHRLKSSQAANLSKASGNTHHSPWH